MNVRMMPPQGPMGQPQPMGGMPAPMPQGMPQGGPMMPPAPTTPQGQQGKGLGSTFGGSVQGRGQFKQFMSAKRQQPAPMPVPQVPQAQMPQPMMPMQPQPMLPAPQPTNMGALRPMGAPQMGGGVELGRPMRGSQGGLGSAPVQLNRGGTVPRRTDIYGQDHMLAYIRPDEAALLKGLGGMGTPGPGGIPQFGFWDSVKSFFSGGGGGGSGGGSSGGGGGGGSSSSSSSSSTSSTAKTNQDRINEIYANSSDPWGTDGAELNKLVKDRDATYVGSADSGANTSWADMAASDPVSMLPGGGGAATGSGGGYDDFASTYDFQKSASDSDPYGTSTASGVITSNGVGADIDTGTGDVTLYNPGKTGGVTIDPVFNFGTGASVADELDAFGGAGPDINPDAMFTTDYYSGGYGAGDYGYTTGGGGVNAGGYDPIGTGSVDDPFVDTTTGGDVDIPTGPSGYPSLDAYVDTYVDPVDTGGGDGGVTTTTPVVTPEPEPAPAPVYYDMFGGEHDTQEAADQFDAIYSAAIEQPVVGGGRDFDVDMDPFVGETSRVTADDYESGVGNTTYFTEGDGSLTISDKRDPYLESLIETGDASSIISAGDVLADDKVGDIADEIIYDEFGNVLGEDLIPASDLLDVDLGINLESPEDFRRTEAGLAGIDYDTGEFIGGDADVDSTKDALMDSVKRRVSEVEGTDDEGGYNRLLGNQEGRFGVNLTDMTVQEVLDFQLARGPGTYADYSNKAVGRISTPAGKYQVVGSTLQDLVERGVVNPNDPFDEETQEKIGSYLIENRGLFDEGITDEQFIKNLGNEFEGIERFGYDDVDGVFGGSDRQSVIESVSPKVSTEEMAKITKQLEDQIDPTLFEEFMGIAVSAGVPYIGSYLADKMKDMGKEQREALVRQHLNAIERGATPIYDDEGNYSGFDMSTMGTFAEEVLSADDISAFLPPTGGMSEEEIARRADADGNGFVDYEEFIDVFEAQDEAADLDPDGMSTENGFIVTSTDEDGNKIETEFFVNADGTVTEVGKSGDAEIVDFDRGGGQEVDDAVKELLGITDDVLDDTGSDDPCPEGYFLDPVTQECVPLTGVGEVDDATAEDISLSLSKIDRPTGGGVTPTPTPSPTGEALKIRRPKQFAIGGPVDLDPNTYDFRGFDADNPFDLGSINAMQKYQVGLTDFDDSQMQLYDLNHDGLVDTSDVTAGLKYINYTNDGVFDAQRANAEDFYLYSPQISLGARPDRSQSTANPTQQPVQQPVQGMQLRKIKQFAAGGAVTPNIDRFLQSLGA